MQHRRAVAELAWFFHRGEHDPVCEVAEAARPSWDDRDTAFSGGWFKATEKHRRIRCALMAMDEALVRVIAAAFESRVYRHGWQRFGTCEGVELIGVAVRTHQFREAFGVASPDDDYDGRHRVTDKWIDSYYAPGPAGQMVVANEAPVHVNEPKIDGFEAFVMTRNSKALETATTAASKMLVRALDAYAEARGFKGSDRISAPDLSERAPVMQEQSAWEATSGAVAKDVVAAEATVE